MMRFKCDIGDVSYFWILKPPVSRCFVLRNFRDHVTTKIQIFMVNFQTIHCSESWQEYSNFQDHVILKYFQTTESEGFSPEETAPM